jgi:hypothetical protein
MHMIKKEFKNIYVSLWTFEIKKYGLVGIN